MPSDKNNKIVSLSPPAKDKPNEHIIEMLETVLQLAKDGEIGGCGIILEYNNYNTGNAFVVQRPAVMLGEIECMKRDVMDAHVELRFHTPGEGY